MRMIHSFNINNFGGGPFFNLISSTSTTFDSYSITLRATGGNNSTYCIMF